MTSVCLGRFHDGRAKANWGGRATSLAACQVITDEGFELASVVNGDYIVHDFGASKMPSRRLDARVHRAIARRMRPKGPASTDDFLSARQVADDLLRRPNKERRLAEVVDAIAQADEFWMNGEGDFILSAHATLFRSMVLMYMALLMEKKVRLVNSILSEPTQAMDEDVVLSVGELLAMCTSVTFRDPTSSAFAQDLYPGLRGSWCPDALFKWCALTPPFVQPLGASPVYGPLSETLDPSLQSLIAREQPYIVISGSSRAVADTAVRNRQFVRLLGEVQKTGHEAVVLATDDKDEWMGPLARASGHPYVGARTTLAAGLLLLAGASCFVSGRYHPSILASLVGTPSVFFESNSHKTTSLQTLLGVDEIGEHQFLTVDCDIAEVLEQALARVSEGDVARSRLRTTTAALAAEVRWSYGTTVESRV